MRCSCLSSSLTIRAHRGSCGGRPTVGRRPVPAEELVRLESPTPQINHLERFRLLIGNVNQTLKMDNESENFDSTNEESTETETGASSTETVDAAALQAKLAEVETTNKQLFERAKKAEGFVKVDGKWVKAPKAEEAIKTANDLKTKEGELTETQLDYLDLKGYTDEEDIDVVQKVMQRTGQTVRQALADDYVVSKLAANKAKRDVQAATPSNTKRAGGQVGDIASAVAKFKDTGVLPEDRNLADAVVDAVAKAGNDRLPPWQRH